MAGSVGAGSAWKPVIAVSVGAGGAWKTAPAIWVGAGGAWKLWHGAGYSATLTAGSTASATGYVLGLTGTISNSVVAPGIGLVALAESHPSGVMILQLSGFTSDPGAGYISSVTINGIPFLTAGASYSYASSVASWQWATSFPFVASSAYAVSIP